MKTLICYIYEIGVIHGYSLAMTEGCAGIWIVEMFVSSSR